MKPCEFYRQCNLSRPTLEGRQHRTTWLPDVYAKVGSKVKLMEPDGTWTEDWEVLSTSDPAPAKIVEANSRNHLKQRKASDIIFSKLKEDNDKS